MPQPNKIKWYMDELVFIKKNFHLMTARQLLDEINKHRTRKIALHSLRVKYYELGLMKCRRHEEWNEREISFLLNNYAKLGNVEICERLNKYQNKSRFFTVKKVWKKMLLMKIKRSEEDLAGIKKLNISNGMYAKSQHIIAEKKRYPEGKKVIRIHSGRKYWYVKHEGNMAALHRIKWEQTNGQSIPPGYKIYFKDGNSLNCSPENLTCLPARGMRYKRPEQSSFDPYSFNDKVTKKSVYVPDVKLVVSEY